MTVITDWSKLKHFKREEFECKCGCGRADMQEAFMLDLDSIRETLGFPLVINSGFRCDRHNRTLSGGPAHPAGVAADVAVNGTNAYRLVGQAYEFGMTGIGVRQSGARRNRYIHLDALDTERYPRPTIWDYT